MGMMPRLPSWMMTFLAVMKMNRRVSFTAVAVAALLVYLRLYIWAVGPLTVLSDMEDDETVQSDIMEDTTGVPVDYSTTLASTIADPCNAMNNDDFRSASGLYCIVTGCENSGTTVVSELIKNAPNLYSGLELGFFLASSPQEFSKVQPFYHWMNRSVGEGFWGMDVSQRNDLTNASCHAGMFRRLRQYSPLYKSALTKGSWIVDKTPRYIYQLTDVMDRSPNTPVVVTLKSRQAQIASWLKRMGPNRTTCANNRYDLAMKGLEDARSKYPERIYVVNDYDLMTHPDEVMTSVFHFLGLRWHEHYKTMDSVNEKSNSVGRRPSPPFNAEKRFQTGAPTSHSRTATEKETRGGDSYMLEQPDHRMSNVSITPRELDRIISGLFPRFKERDPGLYDTICRYIS